MTVSKSASVASTSQGRLAWQEAHRGTPDVATGTRLLTPQEAQTATSGVTGCCEGELIIGLILDLVSGKSERVG